MADLLASLEDDKQKNAAEDAYTAKDIEVLEGLEPVRLRPAMYIGGTDEHALHHLFSEIFDNAMDEAVAGHASRISVTLEEDGSLTIEDNGRGIPIDPHPKFPKKSALEVILTTLHSGGKFSNKAYATSGGLHGVGISVVNALAEWLEVEVTRNKTVYQQSFARGTPTSKLKKVKQNANRRGTRIRFLPDHEIFPNPQFRAKKLYQMARSKAYLFKGVEIRWQCDSTQLKRGDGVPEEETIHFPNGLADFLAASLEDQETITGDAFTGEGKLTDDGVSRCEWALAWPEDEGQGMNHYYCNTIPTPQGGTHETGLRAAVIKSLRGYAEMVGHKGISKVTADDVLNDACVILSVFIPDPQFQGQTKEKLMTTGVAKLVEQALKDPLDHWLSANPNRANKLLEYVIAKAEARLKRREEKQVGRKTPTAKLRLPGKLADCSKKSREGCEIFLVEGDSAGGSAKQARNRETQAILPLRGKILNVASATADKIKANQEVQDMELALGCGTGQYYKEDDLRYEKVIIMTDADVDGAHIAALLMTYFYQEMPQLIEKGHLYLAQPPLYRISQGTDYVYALDDKDKAKKVAALEKKSKAAIEVGRFKGLGEMTPKQLKETTMDVKSRILLQVNIDKESEGLTAKRVDALMGKKPELRFKFIQEQTAEKGRDLMHQLDL